MQVIPKREILLTWPAAYIGECHSVLFAVLANSTLGMVARQQSLPVAAVSLPCMFGVTKSFIFLPSPASESCANIVACGGPTGVWVSLLPPHFQYRAKNNFVLYMNQNYTLCLKTSNENMYNGFGKLGLMFIDGILIAC